MSKNRKIYVKEIPRCEGCEFLGCRIYKITVTIPQCALKDCQSDKLMDIVDAAIEQEVGEEFMVWSAWEDVK